MSRIICRIGGISCKSISKVGFFAANVSHRKVRLFYTSKLVGSLYRQWTEIAISNTCVRYGCLVHISEDE